MQKNHPLTFFEGFSLMCIVFLFHVFNEIMPITKQAGTASWMARGLSALLALGYLMVLYLLISRYEGKDIFQILEEIFGRLLGRLLQLALLAYYFVFVVVNLCETLKLLIDYSYPESGLLLMNVVIMGVVAVCALYSFKGLGKIASIITPLFLLCLALILLFGHNQYDIHLLNPVWGYGLKETGKVGFLLVSNFDCFLIMLAFLGSFTGPAHFRKSGGWAVGVAGIVFVCTSLCVNMAFPYELAEDGTFGLLELAHNIYINRYFQRFESLFIALLALSLLMVVSTGFFAMKKSYCHLFDIPTQYSNAVVLPLAAITVAFLMMVRHSDYLYYYLRMFIQTGVVYFMLGFTLLCLGVSWLGRQGGRGLRTACLALVPCLLSGLLGGCLHYREPDEVAYAIIMGYDKGVTEQYTITLKLLNETGGDNTEREDGDDNLFITEAPSAFTALSMINTIMPKTVSLLHVEMIVISEELAREGIDDLIAPVTRYRETKSSIALVITRCSARDFISAPQAMSTPLPMNTELFVQPYKQVGAYKPMTIAQVFNTYSSNYGDALAMYGSVKRDPEDIREELVAADPEGETMIRQGPPDHDGMQPSSEAESAPVQDEGTEAETQTEDQKTQGGTTTESPNKTQGAKPPGDSGGDEESGSQSSSGEDGGGSGSKESDDSIKEYEHAEDALIVHPEENYFTGFLPGNLPSVSAIKIEIGGMAVFSESRMVGALNTTESAVFMIVDGTYHNANYAVKDPYKPDECNIVLRLRSRRPTEVKVTIDEDGTPHIHLNIFLKAQILISQNTEVDYDQVDQQAALEAYCEEWVKTQADALIQRTQEEFGADIWHFGRHAAGQFRTIPQWEEYNWRERYPDAVIETDIDFKL